MSTGTKSKQRPLRKQDCWIVIAALNEERHLADLLPRVRSAGFANIIVVDDGSRDGTSAVAERHGAVALRHVINLGKGAAMKTGAEAALASGARAIVFVDGDGQHNPDHLPAFFAGLRSHEVVYGYRRLTGPAPLIRRLGGNTINLLFRILYRVRLQDSICGYRAMRADAYRRIRWTARDYSVESEMIARAGKARLSYVEVPIDTVYIDKYKGMTILDGVTVLWNLFWWKIVL